MVKRLLKLPQSKSFFLFGPRQTGKTTLVREAFPQERCSSYNLLITAEYLRLVADPSLLRTEILASPKNITHIFIDEVQRIPELLNEVHALMEERVGRSFILCGSSARKLKRSGANMLGGRAWTLRLHSLTHLELGDQFNLARAMEIGTLPKIYLEHDREAARQYLKSYAETYIKEEIEAEALVRSTGTFLRFLFQAGHESGNLINYSNIARDSGTSHTTVKEYYQILEDTLIGRFLFPYHRSVRKKHSLHPKFYLFDTGVERAIKKQLSLDLLPGTREFGCAFEHWIVNECWRINDYLQKDFEFSYFRTESGAEVDLIIETPKKHTIAVEIKSASKVRVGDLRSGYAAFAKVCKKFTPLCIANIARSQRFGEVEVVPWQEFFKRFAQW
ncbi:MAG: ATP-binding protein [Deltaproteobacteria bacterium]|nr:ATP-binding protein [Deltaproteobacteria bacterium]